MTSVRPEAPVPSPPRGSIAFDRPPRAAGRRISVGRGPRTGGPADPRGDCETVAIAPATAPARVARPAGRRRWYLALCRRSRPPRARRVRRQQALHRQVARGRAGHADSTNTERQPTRVALRRGRRRLGPLPPPPQRGQAPRRHLRRQRSPGRLRLLRPPRRRRRPPSRGRLHPLSPRRQPALSRRSGVLLGFALLLARGLHSDAIGPEPVRRVRAAPRRAPLVPEQGFDRRPELRLIQDGRGEELHGGDRDDSEEDWKTARRGSQGRARARRSSKRTTNWKTSMSGRRSRHVQARRRSRRPTRE